MKKFKIVLYNFLFLVLSLGLLYGEVNSIISPYYVALNFALIGTSVGLFNYIFGITIASFIHDFSVVTFINQLVIIVIMVGFYILIRRRKSFKNRWLVLIGLILFNIVYFVTHITSPLTFALCVINLVLEVAFYYSYTQLFLGISRRGLNTKLAVDEFIGLVLLIIPLATTIYQINIFGVNLGLVIFALIIMLASVSVGALESLSMAVIFGLSMSMQAGSIIPLGVVCLWSLGVSSVRSAGRPLMAIVLIIIDVILGVYFNAYSEYGAHNLIATSIAGGIFMLIPPKIIRTTKARFASSSVELSLNELLHQEEEAIITKTRRLGALFYQIHDIYNNMIIGGLDDNQIVKAIKKGIVNKNCVNCVKRDKCYDGTIIADSAIEDFVKQGVNKQKVGVIDIPEFLASGCGKANYIMHSINAYIEEFNKYKSDIKKEDESKLVVSNQLLGVSEILNNFIAPTTFGKRASKEREKALLDELLYNDIIAKECAIFEENQLFKRAIIIVKNKGYKKSEFLGALRDFFKFKVEIIDSRFTAASGFKMITVVRATKYSYIFGVAKASPKLKSGDLYSKLDLDGGKVMISLSDGKGVGESANRISEMTLSLIENFYKAGYDTNIIMDNVNQVMSFKSGENFSAIDVCVLNLNNGAIDFIKRGGTPSVIKSENGVRVVESDSLPIGMVEGAPSNTKSGYLSSGDVVVLASDGVYDAFNNINDFAGYINNEEIYNMNALAESVLNKAVKLYGGKVKDDMTVVCFRVIINR